MILGAGETSERTAWSFPLRSARQLFVSNRSFERATVLADAIGGRAIRFGDWEGEFQDLDSLQAIAGRTLAARRRRRRHAMA